MTGHVVLVVAAHPDDEVLGCGGTMARHAAEGDLVHALILAEGLTSRDAARDRAGRGGELSELALAAQRANAALGVRSLELLDFPDNRMDGAELLDVVKAVEARLAALKPAIVYTHHGGDVNIDHRVTHQAVVTACRPVPGASVRELLFFEVASSTEWQPPGSAPSFQPNQFVDIGATLAAKRLALAAYAGEMRPWPHARSIEAVEHLAGWRGASCGCAAAEAFVVGRRLR